LLIAFAGFSGIDEQTVFAITDAAVVRVQIKELIRFFEVE
jgi:hypothetical protein